jgi:hypothetical protein
LIGWRPRSIAPMRAIHVKRGNVVEFPLQPIDPERVRLDTNEPCLVLILPVVRIEGRETPAQWVGRILRDVPDRT